LTQVAANQTGKIARAASTVSLAVFASRVLGLVREQIFAGFFGAGYAIDAFVVAFRIPNLLRDLFAEGALSAAFVTVFTDYDQKQGAERTWRLANNVIVCLILLLGGLMAAGVFFSSQLVSLMAPDFGQVSGKLDLTTLMTRIMFPFLPLVSLAAVAMGILNAKGKFFIPSMASGFFNLGIIIAGLALSLAFQRLGIHPIVGMAWGAVVGGLLQLAVQLPLLGRVGFQFRWVLDLRDEGLRRIAKLMLPAVVGLSAIQINIFINTFYAASCPQGSVSWLNYAYRLFHLPMGLFGVALMVATTPVVSRHAASQDLAALKEALRSSLSMAFLVSLPAACGLIFLSRPIIALIYQHGRFTSTDTTQTAAALALYALGLLAFAAVKIMVPVFYALNNTRIPVIGSFLTVAGNLIFINLTLAPLQHLAIALSTSLSMVLNFLFLAAMLYRKLGDYGIGNLLGILLKAALASFLMGAAVYYAQGLLAARLGAGLAGQGLSLAAAILLGLGLYGGLASLLRIGEFQELLRLLQRRGRG